jgi:hypothetical protein
MIMEKKDFYYSKKLDSFLLSNQRRKDSDVAISKFKGKVFTECCDVGEKPVTSYFSDLVFLGSGTFKDVTFHGEY